MNADPNSRRARHLVWLVILTVAVPSLLLTGLGMVAIDNEEAAARRRIEKLYEPVGLDLAKRFNHWIEVTVQRSGPRLAELAEWARAGEPEVPANLRHFIDGTDFAINYFVIDGDGQVLLPAREGGWTSRRDGALREALWAATDEPGRASCAAAGRAAGYERCPEDRCAALAAAALCDPNPKTQGVLQRYCPEWAEDRRMGTAFGILRMNKTGQPLDVQAGAALGLAHMLSDPTVSSPPWLVEIVARRVASALEGQTELGTIALRRKLRSISERGSLLGYLAVRDRVWQPAGSTVGAVSVNDWRRVLVTHSLDGMLVGYELAPDSVALGLNENLVQQGLSDVVTAHLHPTESPKWWYGGKDIDKDEDRMAWWVLLRKTELAWSMILVLDEAGGAFRLEHSRSGMYAWALVLIASALLAGIGYTVFAVVREARLSRLKTDFVSSVSHDLRTPLTSIRMFTETLLMGRVNDQKEAREFLEVIAQETERLSRLTERILDFSRMEAGRKAYAFAPERPDALVQQALRSCRPMIQESRGQVVVDVPESLPPVNGDHDALIEVFINLVNNAIKYSPNQPRIHISARVEGGRMIFSVADEGIGIAAAERARIFEKFHRVDCRRTSEVGGCGIGLSLVKHIVDAHGGEVRVKSTPGRGSTFTVELSLVPMSTVRPPVAMTESESLA